MANHAATTGHAKNDTTCFGFGAFHDRLICKGKPNGSTRTGFRPFIDRARCSDNFNISMASTAMESSERPKPSRPPSLQACIVINAVQLSVRTERSGAVFIRAQRFFAGVEIT